MWSLWKRRNSECARFPERLEESSPGARSVEALVSSLPAEQRAHVLECSECREAAADFVASKDMLASLAVYSTAPGPWFAIRVMGAIAAREAEFKALPNTWAVVPRLASRLTVALAAALLLASIWLYERPAVPPASQIVAESSDSLFETSQVPATHDEVLASLVETDQ